MKNRFYANEVKVPIDVGDIVAMKKTKTQKQKWHHHMNILL
jgi:hypothetical protein